MLESKTSRRVRRNVKAARSQIVAAARARIAAGGPGALRLKDVAADVGVSHSTLLHHFGSREDLVREVQASSVTLVRDALLACLTSGDSNAGLVPAVFDAFREGLAQQLAWLSRTEGFRPADVLPFNEVVDALYAKRIRTAKTGVVPEREDTVNIAHLVVIAAFGDALLGSLFRGTASGHEDEPKRALFQDWLRALIREHLANKASGG